jgi:hypothetical protein
LVNSIPFVLFPLRRGREKILGREASPLFNSPSASLSLIRRDGEI